MRLTTACRAEWPLVRRRVLRTRLGVWLLLLTAGTTLLASNAAATPEGQLARLGLLSAILAASFAAGSATDRAALVLTLGHPATPAELVAGRAAAVFALAAGAVALGVAGMMPLREMSAAAGARALVGGLGAAAAGTGAALAAAWLGGTGAAGALFAYVVLASTMAPAAWEAFAPSGVWQVIGTALLEGLPSLWRYRRLAGGDIAAWAHALAWAVGGSAIAGWHVRRRIR